ncbi:transmembrane protein 88 b isoform X2 [Silurus meridionalis]|uniref:transmembrane protein 88 b isoform X2 n=1 Tax=Silurus meridionalis TaxID=175797 RepID=UPI001EECE2ED|nr:transmembrane protein 88 b isoform X2 [Silurus meridionalis]
MSMTGTLEKGAHHKTLDLSEELPPNHHQQQGILQHSSSTASISADGTPISTLGVVVPPPYSAPVGGGCEAPLELRGSLDCWACSVLVTAQNLVIATINTCLAALVFGLILTPVIVMVMFGFLCHSTVRPQGTSAYCLDQLTDGAVLFTKTCLPHTTMAWEKAAVDKTQVKTKRREKCGYNNNGSQQIYHMQYV